MLCEKEIQQEINKGVDAGKRSGMIWGCIANH